MDPSPVIVDTVVEVMSYLIARVLIVCRLWSLSVKNQREGHNFTRVLIQKREHRRGKELAWRGIICNMYQRQRVINSDDNFGGNCWRSFFFPSINDVTTIPFVCIGIATIILYVSWFLPFDQAQNNQIRFNPRDSRKLGLVNFSGNVINKDNHYQRRHLTLMLDVAANSCC